MDLTFNELVDKILELPVDEKLEIKNVIDHALIDEKRKEIYRNYLESREEDESGKLRFSGDISRLKKQL